MSTTKPTESIDEQLRRLERLCLDPAAVESARRAEIAFYSRPRRKGEPASPW